MPVTDSISDFLTRIRNASGAKHKTVDVPYSNLKFAIAKILKEQGYIGDYEKIEGNVQGIIRVTLRYFNREPAIKKIIRISTPGRRIYAPADRLPRIKNGLGISIISTSKGVLSDKEARKINMGGEILCSVW
ncbi:MAG: small subunit ribosomal protein [Bacteroidota bacterium]|nr:small subunit ribosomal protein [Bacteroidota bacterium]